MTVKWYFDGQHHDWGKYHQWNVCSVQTPTAYNDKFRSVVYFVKPFLDGVKDHKTLEAARKWCEDRFASGLVWC